MNYFIITGTSKGLGKELALLLLNKENNRVVGVSRSCTIQHKSYTHISLDLNDLTAVQEFSFPKYEDAKKITLINNAGIIGEIKHVGNINPKKIIDCYNINLIAPAILCNSFVSTYQKNKAEKLILNISSGAGKSPIDGWSTYCSSKAGLDMLSLVINEETKIKNNEIKVLSLSPGIIDTTMQTEIRAAKEVDFSSINKFIEYKKNEDLTAPVVTAKQVLQFIEQPSLSGNVLCSVRNL